MFQILTDAKRVGGAVLTAIAYENLAGHADGVSMALREGCASPVPKQCAIALVDGRKTDVIHREAQARIWGLHGVWRYRRNGPLCLWTTPTP
jgi:hypothetical protein